MPGIVCMLMITSFREAVNISLTSSAYKLMKDYHFSAGQLNRLRKNDNVRAYPLHTLCLISDCRMKDATVCLRDNTENTI